MRSALLLAILPLIAANACNRNQYWSSELNACISCTRCEKNQILLRPCSTHRDAECSTISHTGVDFPWLKDADKENDIFELADDELPKTGPKKKKNKAHHLLKLSSDSDGDDDIYQDFLHSKHDGKKKDRPKKNHRKHHKFNQRVNDKFLKWDDQPTTRKPHRNRLVFDPFKNLPFERKHHKGHFSFPADLEDDLPIGKGKSEKRSKALHDKPDSKQKSKKFYSEDDEEKLEEWLILSEKELAQRKEDLLKNIKKDEYETDESNPKVKLNYPLYNKESELLSSVSRNSLDEPDNDKHKSIINDDIFKELVKDNTESKLEIETLMSNKKDSQYRAGAGNHRMFMGEPSTISEIIGQVKNPQEMIKDNNFIYEKSKLSVLPVDMDDSAVAAVPFTAVERFVWDWQAVALISAVTACLLFFMVLTAYSVLSNNHHNRAKTACYTADMEEMSTRIALMTPTLEANTAPEGIRISKYPTSLPPTHKS